MPGEIVGKVIKSEAEDLPSVYDLEYRASEDDAWYSVYVVFYAQSQTLTIKYLCTPEVYERVLHAAEFHTESQADELARRFRPISQQLQDHDCAKLQIGATVCAAHGTGDNDLRFYDAVIDDVNRRSHSFRGEEEECLCTFVLFWKHGRGDGTLTTANIGSICTLESDYQIDPRIFDFVTLVKQKISSSKYISVSESLGSASNGPSSLKKKNNVESSQIRPLETKNSMTRKSLKWESEVRSRDEDIGSEPCDVLAGAEGQHFILINNLEKDLNPSSIKKFIFEQTTILPQALVFPRLSSDPFARGAIVVDSQKKVQTIYKFLDNPNNLIVSSRGRPWVITERPFAGTFTSTWKLIPTDLDENIRTDKELEIVRSGTESYKRAKQLRDLFTEYLNHESIVCKKLALEEKKICRSFRRA
ncbi:hypothetical protein ABFX02_12G059300 [Erythranthe guttata]